MSTDFDEQYRNIDWIARDTDGKVQRRTIVQGAAWTIPVVAMTAATPAAAASATPTLKFISGPTSVSTCSTVNGVVVEATTDGTTPASGASIFINLPAGFTWSDGTRAGRTFTADANGRVTLNGIKAPSNNTTQSFTARWDGLFDRRQISTSGQTGTIGATWNENYFPTLPTGVTASDIGYAKSPSGASYGYVLGSDNRLYQSTSGGAWTTVASNVTHMAVSEANGRAIYSTASGVYLSGETSYFPAIPAATAPPQKVGYTTKNGTTWGYYLGSNGVLYRSTDGGAWTRVSTSGVRVTDFSVSTTDGGAVYQWANGVATTFGATYSQGLPDAAKSPQKVAYAAVEGGARTTYVLGADNKLYRSTNFGDWTVVSGNATVRDFSISETDGRAVFITDIGVGKSWGGTGFPALPNAARAPQQAGYTTSGGSEFAYVLGNDGKVYRSVDNGAWTVVSPSGKTANDLSVSTTDGGAIYALTPSCA